MLSCLEVSLLLSHLRQIIVLLRHPTMNTQQIVPTKKQEAKETKAEIDSFQLERSGTQTEKDSTTKKANTGLSQT